MTKIKSYIISTLILALGGNLHAQNLILHLPMAGNSIDNSQYQNNGNIIGGVSVTEDRFGNPCGALKFNGIDGFISIPNSSPLAKISEQFTLSTWIKLDKTQNNDNLRWLTLLCKGEDVVEDFNMPQYRVQIFQGNTQSTISINTEFTKNDLNFKNHNLDFNKWYHIVVTYDGRNVNFYINSQLVWNHPYYGDLYKNNSDLNIGRDIPGSTEFFKGSMSDYRLYDNALNSSQIKKLNTDSESFAKENSIEHICPTDKKIQTIQSKCIALALVENPTVKTNCGSYSISQIKGPQNGEYIELGIDKIVFKIIDNHGASRICSYNIEVIDNENPKITPRKDTTIIIAFDEQSFQYNYALPIATDNCAIKSIHLINGISSNDNFPLGKTKLEFEAIDNSGNKSYSQYTVNIIQDKSKPVFKATPPKQVVQIDTISLVSSQIIPLQVPTQSFDQRLETLLTEVGSKIEIEDVYFYRDKSDISKKSAQQLDIVVNYLNKYNNISIEISGHTNGAPSDKYCDQLSNSRAKACYDYFILKGISKDRLIYIGQGKKQLKFPNDPNNSLNQRVEITITEIK